MRIRSVKGALKICFGNRSKGNVTICWIYLFIFNLTIYFFFFVQIKSSNCLYSDRNPSSTYDDLLDKCMLEKSPCYPGIDQALDRYFSKVKNRFSMLLKYHPRIDCEYGRYLLLNDVLSSHTYHGTGSQLMWYLGVLNVAYVLNLTLIHLEWSAEHSNDELNSEREKYWKFDEWEIPYSVYKSCPKNSSIKRNIFNYNLISTQTFDQHHQGKQTFTIMKDFKSLFDQFLDHLPNRNMGFTFYSNKTYTITSSLMELGVVFETRWWLQHRKLYNEQNGVWSGLPIRSNYFPIDYFQYIRSNPPIKPVQCPSIDIDETLLIGVHIRQGDVVKRHQSGRIISADLYRYMSNSAYSPLLITIINSLPVQIRKNYLITIYSEGFIEDFLDILTHLKTHLPETRCRIAFFLNGRTSETFNRLLRDDILIGTFSTFSMAAGIFNTRQLKIGPMHNRARVHGMRNHLTLDVNLNHTRFLITHQKQLLIKQRIKYVWEEKQKQLKSPIPLWLDNYSQDYPEDFMLI